MNNSAIVLIIVLIIVAIVLIACKCNKKVEGFDAIGMYTVPPNWFVKKSYDPSQWVVNQYVDSIQPECMSYDRGAKFGSLENINYMASASRFWRF